MRLFRLLALLGVTACWTGCGLPDSYFLVPPAVNTQATPLNPVFKIVGTKNRSEIDTSADFQGYELYYKFYGLENDATGADATAFGTGSTNTDLTQAGFHRMCLGTLGSIDPVLTRDTSAGFASAPLIDISQLDSGNIEDTYEVRIRLNEPSTIPEKPAVAYPSPYNFATLSYYVYNPPNASAATKWEEVRRFVTVTSGTGCKTFASDANAGTTDNYDPDFTDADLSGSTGSTIWSQVQTPENGGDIFVRIYALSYGTSRVDGTPVYSSPVNLGYVRINVD